MDVKGDNQMNLDNWPYRQHELLKTAMEATDSYLGVKKHAKEHFDQNMRLPGPALHDFSYHMSRAHEALQALGVLDEHQPYMTNHVADMAKMHGHDDSTIADLPGVHVPAADFGEVEEAFKMPAETAQEKMYRQHQELRKKRGLPDPEHYKKIAQQKQKEIEDMKESKEFWDSAKERADEPKEKLSPAWKSKAKARAAAAGRKYPNMVDNVWAAQQQESIVLNFKNYIQEKLEPLESIKEEDIDDMVEGTTWEDIVDLYDSTELVEEDDLDEALSAQSRLKKRQAFMRGKSKRNMARGLKLRRASSPETLKKRAISAARRAVYKRILRGRNKSNLSAAEKSRIEQQVSQMKNMQSAIVTKMMPKIRSIEQARLAHYRGGK